LSSITRRDKTASITGPKEAQIKYQAQTQKSTATNKKPPITPISSFPIFSSAFADVSKLRQIPNAERN